MLAQLHHVTAIAFNEGDLPIRDMLCPSASGTGKSLFQDSRYEASRPAPPFRGAQVFGAPRNLSAELSQPLSRL